MTQNAPRTAIISVSSHVIRGTVGNRASAFALEALGFPVWSMPTVVLPWHPGHGPSTRMTFPDDMFEKAVDDLVAAPWIGEVRAVMTGYFGSPAQPAVMARLIRRLREVNPALVYLCDPVMGDFNGLYVPQATAEAIRDHLMPLATIATPNRFEFGWLTGRTFESNTEMAGAAGDLGVETLVVTSAFPMMAKSTGTLLLSGKAALLAEHRLVEKAPNGLGDLFSALFLAQRLRGPDEEALRLATASVLEVLQKTVQQQADELVLESAQESLARPLASVSLRHLVVP
ncbi:pyridoxal kinase PdxY [Allorhizobium undicola]|uniref:pyridoxal kinase PdxY n=1 Tax=Allorhizobium undicola TaxID=78527 RepID=UPI003D332B5A